MAKDGLYQGSREVRTFVDLHHGADVLIGKSDAEERGSYYTTMGALLLTAFTFEAYLNHLGSAVLPFWEHIESIRVMDKYAVLCKHFGIDPDFSKRPHYTLRRLFKFRNAIAHGKSQILEESKEVSLRTDPYKHSPRTHWEEYCTNENAKQAQADVEAVVIELNVAAGRGDYPFVGGVTISSLSAKPPDEPA